MAKEYEPAHVIHEATCPDVPPNHFAFKARSLADAYPTSRPHTCFTRDTVTFNREVVAEPVMYEPHGYKPSTIRPEDATRALCEVCRGTHGSGGNWLLRVIAERSDGRLIETAPGCFIESTLDPRRVDRPAAH